MAKEAKKVSLEEETLNTLELASAVMNKAAEDYRVKEATASAVATKIPEVTEILVTSSLIDHEDKEAMAKALHNPVQALEALKLAAERVRDLNNGNRQLPVTPVNRDGTPARDKSASIADNKNRRHSFEADRDAQWERDMGR